MDDIRCQSRTHHEPTEGVGETVSRRCHQVLAGSDGALDQHRGHTQLPSKMGGAVSVTGRCGM